MFQWLPDIGEWAETGGSAERFGAMEDRKRRCAKRKIAVPI